MLSRLVVESVCDAIFWGIGLTALVWCLQALTRRTNAGTRHAVWCVTLAAVVLLPLLIVGARYSSLAEMAPDALTGNQEALCGFWAMGSFVMLARLLVSSLRLRRLVRRAAPMPVSGSVLVYSSPDISSPMAAGVTSPVILLPAGLASRLSEAEMEHVILHEKAHIRRGDPWTNFGVRLAEALFFFHPAVRWIAKQLRLECEIACDDWVVAATGEARPYAASLVHLVELTVFRSSPLLATAAVTNKPQISRRIEMLMERGRNRSPRPEAFGITAAAVLVAMTALCCAYAPPLFALGPQAAPAHALDICRSNFWSSFTLKSRGNIEFADTDRDVKSISADGSLMIEEREGLTWRKLSFTPRGTSVERTFWINGGAEPFEPDGRRWMEEILPRVIRETGVGAAQRVDRIMRQGGVDGVLAEITRIESNRSKRLYFLEVVARTTDSGVLRRILRQATHEIDSDGDRRRLLAHLLDRAPLMPDLLQAGARLESDGEKAGFLLEALHYYPEGEATRALYFKALNTINSDGERRRVLSALLRRPRARDDAARIFSAAAKLNSDGEKAGLLVQGAGELSGLPSARRAWFSAADTIRSDGEHRRALEAALRNDGRDRDMLLSIIHSATGISSDGEKASILSQVARVCPDDDAVVQAIVDSAQTLRSEGEYRRVITPLVRKGRSLRVVQKI
jgi:beta-lactamase regulating signal transducer with metallopeptidase domain